MAYGLRVRRDAVDAALDASTRRSGWKLVHADVFRPPDKLPMLFCVCVGTGVQVLLCAAIALIFAAAGLLSPANRGSLATAVLVLFVMMGIFAGYASATLYKTFKGRLWQKCTLMHGIRVSGDLFWDVPHLR